MYFLEISKDSSTIMTENEKKMEKSNNGLAINDLVANE